MLTEIDAIGIFIGNVKFTPALPLTDREIVEENSMLSISSGANGLHTGRTFTSCSVTCPMSGRFANCPSSKSVSFPVTRDAFWESSRFHDGRKMSSDFTKEFPVL